MKRSEHVSKTSYDARRMTTFDVSSQVVSPSWLWYCGRRCGWEPERSFLENVSEEIIGVVRREVKLLEKAMKLREEAKGEAARDGNCVFM